MLLNKFLGLMLIALLAVSSMSAVSATTIHIDGDWRLVFNFKFTDLSTGENIWSCNVAAGDGHTMNFDANPHKLHQIGVTVTPYGYTNPGYISKVINVYNGGDLMFSLS
ncbi:MAG: hypothetical protein LBD03_03005 [Methanobrevibacter sp.]|jgi:hypothetical protein|nr:hypothetical protein [Candidatus Methanovirga procula]